MIYAMNLMEICRESSAGLRNIWLPALTPNQRKTVQTKPVPLKTELNSSKNGKKLSAPFIMEPLTSPTDLSANVTGKLPIIKTSLFFAVLNYEGQKVQYGSRNKFNFFIICLLDCYFACSPLIRHRPTLDSPLLPNWRVVSVNTTGRKIDSLKNSFAETTAYFSLLSSISF